MGTSHDISDLAVGAIAQWPVYGVLAAAKIDFLIFRRGKLDRRQAAALMGTIAQRLFGRFAAGTPEVVFAFFDVHCIGCFLCNYRITHVMAFPIGVCLDCRLFCSKGSRRAHARQVNSASTLSKYTGHAPLGRNLVCSCRQANTRIKDLASADLGFADPAMADLVAREPPVLNLAILKQV